MGKISLVLPVYNEQIILRDVLNKYLADLENIQATLGYAWEVVAVDDCSSDESKLILMDFAKRYRNFKVVSLANRAGKHAAVSAGFTATTGSVVMTAEIDLQNPQGLFTEILKEHLNSGVPIIYGYQEFVGWKKRKAFMTDRLTRFACRLFLIDGYFTGIVNVELYAADVVDVLRQNPVKNKYMRTMNNWVGWESREFWYAREYSDEEAKIKQEQLRKRSRHYQGYKKHGRENSATKWWALLCVCLAAVAFGVAIYIVPRLDMVVTGLMFTLGFAMLALALLFCFRSLLLTRIGKLNFREGEIIYEIKSILNK